MKKILQIFLLCLCISLPDSDIKAQSSSELFNWEEYNRTSVALVNIQFTPDGNHLLLTKYKADIDNNRMTGGNVLYNINTKEETEFKTDIPGSRSFMWSPSGSYLAFIGIHEGGSQIFVQDYPDAEPEPVTNHPNGISSFSWAPDESHIAFLSEDPAPEKPEEEKFITAFEVGPHGYLDTDPYLPTHLYVTNISTKETRRLTEGNWDITSGIDWSADSKKIAFTKKEDAFPSDWNANNIIIYDLETGTMSSFSDNSGYEFDPEYSPDGRHFLYWDTPDKNPAGMSDLMIKSGNKAPVNLTRSIDRYIKDFAWLPGNKEILMYGMNGTKDGVWVVDTDGKKRKAGFSDQFVISSLAINDQGKIAMLASAGHHPSEIFIAENTNSAAVKISSYNQHIADFNLGKVETLEWETDLGITTDGTVTYPPDFNPDKKYPLVLKIHGGPTGTSQESFDAVAQLMASKGWMVFQPNYRGSNNRGDAFQEAIMNDGGEGPGRDVMAGIKALKQQDIIDEDNIAVTGWSYGGFMTAWLIGRYPDEWKAAVAGAAPVDFTDMTSLTTMNLTLRHAITNSPWVGDNYKLYYEMSPLKNLSKIKTPTLILSKVEDQVVSVTGSYKLYHALLANDVPVKFIAYPGGGHFPGDPANRKDVYDRWVNWLETYLD